MRRNPIVGYVQALVGLTDEMKQSFSYAMRSLATINVAEVLTCTDTMEAEGNIGRPLDAII